MREYRLAVPSYINGVGLEIGAMGFPMPVGNAKVYYLDRLDVAGQVTAFKCSHEAERALVPVDFVIDVDKDDFHSLPNEQYDFVIMSHLLEHVANPIKVFIKAYNLTRFGGKLVIAIPDKRYIFDRNRNITTYEHLINDYKNNVTDVADDHFYDFLFHADPGRLNDPNWLAICREQSGHAHVWDTASSQVMFKNIIREFSLSLECIFESVAEESNNQHEHFAIWQKYL